MTFNRKYGRFLLVFLNVPLIVILVSFAGDFGFLPTGTDLDKSDWLGFWAGYLSFAGSLILGVIALWQNDKANEMNDMMAKLTQESNELVKGNQRLEISRNKPVLEVVPLILDEIPQPFVSKTEKDYDIKFNIFNSSSNNAFNIKTTDIWISEAFLNNDSNTINSKERFEIPKYKFDWGINYDFQGYLRSGDLREFQTGIKFIDKEDIKPLTNKYGGRYFLSVTFSFDDCYGKSYIETTTMLISRVTDFETGNLKHERIFDNKIELKGE